MTKKIYTFNLDMLTWGDVFALFTGVEQQQISIVWAVVMKCLPGATDLPFREINPVVQQFGVALKEAFDAANDDATPDAMRVLRGMFGEQGLSE